MSGRRRGPMLRSMNTTHDKTNGSRDKRHSGFEPRGGSTKQTPWRPGPRIERALLGTIGRPFA